MKVTRSGQLELTKMVQSAVIAAKVQKQLAASAGNDLQLQLMCEQPV